jgi:hypothetical protein
MAIKLACPPTILFQCKVDDGGEADQALLAAYPNHRAAHATAGATVGDPEYAQSIVRQSIPQERGLPAGVASRLH